jgi:EmrB/QacA subfamily drug resistance transporter
LDDSGSAPRAPRKLRLLVPLIVAIAFLMEQLDSTIIVTAIPQMAKSLGATPVQLNLAVTAYVVTLAVFIPVSGWFADRFGARLVFVLALGLFTLGSALCGTADSFAQLVAMRVVQGVGGAMMTPVGRLIMLRSFPRSELVTVMTYMSLPALLGPLFGPLLGGVLTTYLAWRWIFYVNLPIGLAAMALALRYFNESPGERGLRFDFPGFVMVGGGVGLMQMGLDGIGQQHLPLWVILALLAAAAGLLALFARYARTAEAPALDLSLFRLRSFSIGTLAGGVCRIGLNGTPFLLPLMLQIGFGMSPVESGALVLLASAGSISVRAFIKPMLRRFGFGLALTGSAIASSLILAGFALMQADTPHWLIGGYVALFGLIRSIQLMTSNMLSYADTPDARLSHATSLFGALQQLTISLGVSFAAVMLSLLSLPDHVLTPARFHAVFLLSAVLPLLALPGFLKLRAADGAAVSGYGR